MLCGKGVTNKKGEGLRVLKRVVLTQNVRGGCGNQYRGNSVEDEERQYFFLIPQAASESAKLPVIVVFHGQGGDFYRMIGQFQSFVNKRLHWRLSH